MPLFGAEEAFFDVFQCAVLFAKADKQPEYTVSPDFRLPVIGFIKRWPFGQRSTRRNPRGFIPGGPRRSTPLHGRSGRTTEVEGYR